MAENPDYNTVNPNRVSQVSTGHIRGYKDLGRHSSLIIVLVLNLIEILCLALTFVFPVFQRTPYDDYTINYYWTFAEYDDYGKFGGRQVEFTECGEESDKNCSLMQSLGMLCNIPI